MFIFTSPVIFYQRNIDNRRLLLRIASFFLVSAILLSWGTGSVDLACVLVLTLLVCAVFPLSTLQIGLRELTVTQYYFFGWVPRKVTFEKEQPIHLQTYEIMLDPSAGNDRTEYLSSTTFEKYLLRQDNRRAKTQLNRQELAMIEKYFTVIHATTAPPAQP